jgi:hypothetical protein
MSEADLEYPAELREIAGSASAKITANLAAYVPGLAPHVIKWIGSLSASGDHDYFLHSQAFPMLLLPWWLEISLCGKADHDFQAELVYASMSGYYFTRIIDDLMDRDRPPDSPVLPALIYFHTEFEQSYQGLFVAGDPFWEDFRRYSYQAADSASLDAALSSVTEKDFDNTSSRKVAGAKIALAAVCHHYGRVDVLPAWAEMVDGLGRWHQMLNDMVGWIGDLEHDQRTYFLSHARNNANTLAMSVPEWILRYGIDWGADRLEASMAAVTSTASRLESPPLVSYLDQRQRQSGEQWTRLKVSLASLAGLG